MKDILFKQGKLYYVELPDKAEFYETIPGTPDCIFLHEKYETAYKKALANKVEVKNTEFILFKNKLGDWHTIHPYLEKKGQKLKDGDTFPLPDGIEV